MPNVRPLATRAMQHGKLGSEKAGQGVSDIATRAMLPLFHCHQQLHMDYGFMALLRYA
jgi:hypothetical protein